VNIARAKSYFLFCFCFLFEIFFRLLLFIFYCPERLCQIIVYFPCPWIYDRKRGFNYTKRGYNAATINFINGKNSFHKTFFTTNSDGNVGIAKASKKNKTLLILGDSFSVGVGDPPNRGTWPDLLAASPQMKGFSVLNYSRDGTGVLNMVDTAVDLLRRKRIDHILFALYIGDFTRPKIWRAQKLDPGNILDRCFVGQHNDLNEIFYDKIDVAFVSSKVSKINKKNALKILSEAEKINNEYFPRKNIIFNDNALLAKRIINGTCQPLLKKEQKSSNFSLSSQNLNFYLNTKEFAKKCQFIKKRAKNTSLFLLPDYDNLISIYKNNKCCWDINIVNFINKFENVFETKFYNLANQFTEKEGHPRKYFRAEVNDYHFSNTGLSWVAACVAKKLNES